MSMGIRGILTALGVLLAMVGKAQCDVIGIVRAAATGAPIEGVEIFDEDEDRITTSDSEGVFELFDLASGVHTFIVFGENYDVLSATMELKGDTSLVFDLVPISIELTAVEIEAKRVELFGLRQLRDVEGTEIYAGKKSEVVVLDLLQGNFAANNSRQVYAQVAGLNIYEGSDGGLQLGIGGRGLDPNRTANFNSRQNSYDISADVLGYPENYYTPPTEALEEIQIIRGASSLQYGTQFGGLINFRMREIPRSKKWGVLSNQTFGSNNFFNTFNWVGANLGKFSVNGYFNFKKGDGFRPNSEFDLTNLFFSVDYELNRRTSVKLEYTYYNYLARQAGGLTDQQFAEDPYMSTRERNWFEVDWQLFNLRLDHKFENNGNLSVSLFGLNARRNSVGFRGNPLNLNENPITSIDEQDSDGNYIYPRDLIKGKFRNVGAEIRYLQRYSLSGLKSVGLVGAKLYTANNTSLQGAGSTGVDPDFNDYTDTYEYYPNQSDYEFPNRNVAVFAENILYINNRLSVTPGVRFEYINTRAIGSYKQVIYDIAGNPISSRDFDEDEQFKRSFVLFGIGMNYNKSEVLNIYANLSQNYRSVTFSDIRTVNPTFIVDPDISDERGFTADVGVRGRAGKALSYNAGLYSVLYNDRIGVILDDRANRVRTNIGSAVIAGIESLVDVELSELLSSGESGFKWNVFLNSAFTYSEYLSSQAQNVTGKQVEFVPNVNIKTGTNVAYEGFNLGFQYSYISQQYTDAQNSPIAPAGDKRSGIVGEIPAYQVLDLTLKYTYKYISIETGVNNLLNEAYFTRRATGYPGPGIIPSDGRTFFVTLGFRY